VIGRWINTKRSGRNGYADSNPMTAATTILFTSVMPLPDKAKKLILLLMDGAASVGEQDTATRKLIVCLRTNFKDGYEMLKEWGNGTASTPPPPSSHPSTSIYGAFRLPFGQYKGRALRVIPTNYLLYLLNWQGLWPDTRRAIRRYLENR